MRRLSVLLAICVGLVTCRTSPAPAESSDAGTPPPTVTFETGTGEHLVRVEVASTPRETQRGLMFRESLPSGEGMLFVFDHDADHGFWMKNTLIPLDMVFVAADGRVVGVVHEAAPLTEQSRRVGRPSRYVVEVPGGWARAHRIEAGTRVRFENVPGL